MGRWRRRGRSCGGRWAEGVEAGLLWLSGCVRRIDHAIKAARSRSGDPKLVGVKSPEAHETWGRICPFKEMQVQHSHPGIAGLVVRLSANGKRYRERLLQFFSVKPAHILRGVVIVQFEKKKPMQAANSSCLDAAYV